MIYYHHSKHLRLWRSVALLLIVFSRLVHLSLNYLRLAGQVFPDVGASKDEGTARGENMCGLEVDLADALRTRKGLKVERRRQARHIGAMELQRRRLCRVKSTCWICLRTMTKRCDQTIFVSLGCQCPSWPYFWT